jgi:hypothetical protein
MGMDFKFLAGATYTIDGSWNCKQRRYNDFLYASIFCRSISDVKVLHDSGRFFFLWMALRLHYWLWALGSKAKIQHEDAIANKSQDRFTKGNIDFIAPIRVLRFSLSRRLILGRGGLALAGQSICFFKMTLARTISFSYPRSRMETRYQLTSHVPSRVPSLEQ